MKDKHVCPSCQKDVVLQQVADNYNLCYHCNSDLNTISALKNYYPSDHASIKSQSKSKGKIKKHNKKIEKATSDELYNGQSIRNAGLFILLSGICSMLLTLIVSVTDISDIWDMIGLLKFLGISSVISLCIGGFYLMNHSN